MQDIDSAVGRLDNILMSVYFIVVILIMAVALVRIFIKGSDDFQIEFLLGSTTRHGHYGSGYSYSRCALVFGSSLELLSPDSDFFASLHRFKLAHWRKLSRNSS